MDKASIVMEDILLRNLHFGQKKELSYILPLDLPNGFRQLQKTAIKNSGNSTIFEIFEGKKGENLRLQ